MKLVYGVGINDKTRRSRINGKITREYAMWANMLERCYSDRFHKIRPSYVGCTVSPEFLSYSNFYDWCQEQTAITIENPRLDKDILVKGNKIYSRNTCCIVPNEINALLIKRDKSRGCLPIGVQLCKQTGTYRVMMTMNSKVVSFGRHPTPGQAFAIYKREKEKYIKDVTNRHRSTLDSKTYEALMNYSVEITD